MELSTPSKGKVASTAASSTTATTTPITASLSRFENSPVFNYIDSLSPIVLARSTHNDQTFSLLSFSSPPSVFTSPQISFQKDGRPYVRRHQYSEPEPSNTELQRSKDDAVKQLQCSTSENPADKVTAELANELTELTVDLPKDSNSSTGTDNMALLNAIRTDTEQVSTNSNKICCSYESEKHLRKICRIGKSEEEGADWVMLISNVADVLNLDSFTTEGEGNTEHQKMVDPGTSSFMSEILQIPQDNSTEDDKMESSGCVDTLTQSEEVGPGVLCIDVEEREEADQTTSGISDTSMNMLVVKDATKKVDVKGKKCSQFTCKPQIRRRCLFSDTAGAHKKKSMCSSISRSLVSTESDLADGDEHLTPVKRERGSKFCTLSETSVDLHLSDLLTTSRDGKILQMDNIDSGEKEINLNPGEEKDDTIEKDTQIPTADHEENGMDSPKIKRLKLEYVGAACKRCNCKRSKCLKLYCDCFAAGLYCIEPCSCQGCFNTPAHEATVLETRKQIESRNPLAFAPKVIRGTDSVPDFGVETNKTPASARHKRGCNCKKSSCLKKYCECYQGGVGCSPNCRCEGCKNTFGTKAEFREGCETRQILLSDKSSHDDTVKNDENEHPDIASPHETARSPTHRPSIYRRQLIGSFTSVSSSTEVSSTSSQKLRTPIFKTHTKFQTHLQAIPEDETPDILTSNCSPISDVNAASPNRKRVSPPHHGFGSSTSWGGRKLILRSVPLFPSLNSLDKS